MWDRRYSKSDYLYGKEPNDFVVQAAPLIPPGPVLCLAAGEGRNAVYLAQQGYAVKAVDISIVGLDKAKRLAAAAGVEIETEVVALADFKIPANYWGGILSIFAPLPPIARAKLHRQCVAGLVPGGMLVLEAYTPAQLQLKTGGPATASLMMDLAILHHELAGLEFKYGVETERQIVEGSGHHGLGSVVQVIAVKPGL
ncbi:SAM-dependent methyltransferase [filamentous cyanobacterium CCP5]|nr:SAM-dependent methyltransferase [filamentous cyanobacterium CCP5]